MAESERITVRLPADLRSKAEQRADDLGLAMGDYVRSLIAADVGAEPPIMRPGPAPSASIAAPEKS